MSSPEGPPRMTIYEVLTAMAERIGWQSEQQRVDVIDTIRKAEQFNALGVVAKEFSCSHPPEMTEVREHGYSGRYYTKTFCRQCGKELTR